MHVSGEGRYCTNQNNQAKQRDSKIKPIHLCGQFQLKPNPSQIIYHIKYLLWIQTEIWEHF